MKLVTHVCHIVSMTTKQQKSLGQFSYNLLLHSHNLLSIGCMEMKLIVHVYHIVSMTTTRQQIASGNFIKIEPQASVFISKERHKNGRRQVNEKSCEF